METTTRRRRRTTISLPEYMLTDLSNEARRRKTTISKLLEDFVEPALYQQPNPETLAAIEEARGKEQEDCSGCWYSLAPCSLPLAPIYGVASL